MPEASPQKRTFIEVARRAQIVAGAIEAIAELGYAQASLARIAERLGVSKGVIFYHFANKDDLVKTIVAEVLVVAGEYMRLRVSPELDGPALLRTYIESNLAFMAEHRNEMVAMVEIAANASTADGRRPYGPSIVDAGVEGLERLLASRQRRGEFRGDFDPAAMAMALRAAIDAAPRRLARDSAFDIEHFGHELADIFLRATGEVR